MKKILAVPVLVYCLSCTNHKVTDNPYMAKYIDSILTNIDTSYIVNTETDLFYNILKQHKETHRHQYGFIYILNAECSACIAGLFNFIQLSQKLKEEIPVYAIIEKQNMPVVEYYLEKAGLTYPHLSFHDHSVYQYTVDIKESSGQVYVLYNSQIVSSFHIDAFNIKQ